VAVPYDDLAVMPLPPGGSWLAGLPTGRVRHNVVWVLELAKEVQELVGWLVASGGVPGGAVRAMACSLRAMSEMAERSVESV
jgi:hypothetical protein